MKIFLSCIFLVLVVSVVLSFAFIMSAFMVSTDESIEFAVRESVESTLLALRFEVCSHISFIVPLMQYLGEQIVTLGVQLDDPTVPYTAIQPLLENWPPLFKENRYAVTHVFHNFWDPRHNRWSDVVCGAPAGQPEFCGLWVNDTFHVITDSKNFSLDNTIQAVVAPNFGTEPWFLSMPLQQEADIGRGVFIRPYHLKNAAFNDLQLTQAFQVPLRFSSSGKCTSAISGALSMEWLGGVLKKARRHERSFVYVLDAATNTLLATTLDIPLWDKDTCFEGIASEAPLFQFNETSDARITSATSEAISRFGPLRDDRSEEARIILLDDAIVSFIHIRSTSLRNLHWVVFHHVERTVYFGNADSTRNDLVRVSAGVTLSVVVLCCLTWLFIHSNLRIIASGLTSTANLMFKRCPEPVLGELQGLYHAEAKLGSAVNSFTRYVPRDVVRSLMESGEISTIAMHPRRCTVLFVDIANFTAMCENIDIVTLSGLLEGFFGSTTAIVTEHHGVVDKYIGDCVMAVWGAPEPVADSEQLAVLCALRIAHACRVPPLSSLFEQAGQRLRVRIGVHCGDMLAGNMGCDWRMNYTVIGDAVNTAARLEPLCKQLGTQILISDAILEAAAPSVRCFRLGKCKVFGKDEAVGLHEPYAAVAPPHASSPLAVLQARAACLSETLDPAVHAFARDLGGAVDLCTRGDLQGALAATDALAPPAEHSTKVERLRERIIAALNDSTCPWDGIFRAESK